jgi:GT2 family glycosyltransferase
MSAPAPAVTAAIATYNGIELLPTVLHSLTRQTCRDFRTVVVDDASSDGTVAWLRERWPDVQVVEHPRNRGVTAALNSCLQAGRGSEYVLLLNNDVELDERCVEELLAALRADPSLAVAQAKLVDFTRRDLLDGTGDTYSWSGIAHRRGQGEPDRGQYDGQRDVFGTCAAAAIYRAAAVLDVGEFDERLHALCEDVDWSFRARLAGYRCAYVPEAVAYHIGSASLGPRVSEFTLYHNWRNQLWVIAKDYPAASLLRHCPDILMGLGANLYVAARHRSLRVLARAWRDALLGLPGILAERRAIQRSRRAGAAQLEPVIESGPRKLWWWLAGSGRATAPAARRQPPPGGRAADPR